MSLPLAHIHLPRALGTFRDSLLLETEYSGSTEKQVFSFNKRSWILFYVSTVITWSIRLGAYSLKFQLQGFRKKSCFIYVLVSLLLLGVNIWHMQLREGRAYLVGSLSLWLAGSWAGPLCWKTMVDRSYSLLIEKHQQEMYLPVTPTPATKRTVSFSHQ